MTKVLIALFFLSWSCSKPRGWTVAPTEATSLTMEALDYRGPKVWVDITLPENYERKGGGVSSTVTWQRHGSPKIQLNLGGKIYPSGCRSETSVMSTRTLRKDGEVVVCGKQPHVFSVNSYFAIMKEQYLWCKVDFEDEYKQSDIDNAIGVCSSIRWIVTGVTIDCGESSSQCAEALSSHMKLYPDMRITHVTGIASDFTLSGDNVNLETRHLELIGDEWVGRLASSLQVQSVDCVGHGVDCLHALDDRKMLSVAYIADGHGGTTLLKVLPK